MKRQGHFKINIKRARLIHWKEKVKTKKLEPLAPYLLLLGVKLQN
jgi:hypothetical protein